MVVQAGAIGVHLARQQLRRRVVLHVVYVLVYVGCVCGVVAVGRQAGTALFYWPLLLRQRLNSCGP